MPVTAATIFLSAFLLFLVQPIVAKQILPWFGGSAAVWTTCLLFFQVVLLLGYGYAHLLSRLERRRHQALVHTVLLVASLAFLPIIPGLAWRPGPNADPTVQILVLLGITVGLPYFLLSSSGPLLQAWLVPVSAIGKARTSIYRLFALSNIGSLCGLLAYPFAIEPFIATRSQAWVWSSAFVLYCAGCARCAWRDATGSASTPRARADAGSGPVASPDAGDFVRWLACAALGSALLLAITNHLLQNIASIPFLWVVPLALYLLSFVICFEGRGGAGGYSRRVMLVPGMILTAAMGWALVTHNAVLSIYASVPLFSVGLLVGCCICHGEIAASKPAPQYLTQFYLALAAGGALGGLLVAVLAPHIFDYYWETPLALLALALLAAGASVAQRPRPGWGRALVSIVLGTWAAALILACGNQMPGIELDGFAGRWAGAALGWHLAALALAALAVVLLMRWHATLAIATACVLCTASYGWDFYRFIIDDTEFVARDFYGTLRIKPVGSGPERSRRLMHGVILHGEQFVEPGRARLPTTYYGPTSGIGRTIMTLRDDSAPLRVASIGLGTGTLAAYAEKDDHWQIFEIDPAVRDVALHRFTYVPNSLAPVEIVMGDARLSLEAMVSRGEFADPNRRYDVLSVDAFSSDAIPVHLITREALALFASIVKADGVIAFHISNRYLDLAPVVAKISAANGFECLEIDDAPQDKLTYSSTEWVLVTHNQRFLADERIAPFGHPILVARGLRLWTDQFSNLMQILR